MSVKITDTHKEPEEKIYNYKGYGDDHQKVIEEKKEKNREKLRKQVELEVLKYRKNDKDKLLNTDLQNGGNLALPSFKKAKDHKEEYKRSLLNKIEADCRNKTRLGAKRVDSYW